jgi:hypothetical protein
MTTLYAFPTYISLTFVARFTCSNGLVCCVCDKVSYGDKAGFHAIERYWEGVTANRRWWQLLEKNKMKYKTILFFLLSWQIVNAQKEIKLVPEMWTSTIRFNEKHTFLATESIHLGYIEGHRFYIIFGQNKETEKYYIITEIVGAPIQWYFTDKIKLISGQGIETSCLARYLNSNEIYKGLPLVRSLFFLTTSEYKNLESHGLTSVEVSMKQNGNSGETKSYTFNNFKLVFDLRDKEQRKKEGEADNSIELEKIKKEEQRLRDSIVQETEFATKARYEEEAKRKAELDRTRKAELTKKKSGALGNGIPGTGQGRTTDSERALLDRRNTGDHPIGNSAKVSSQIEGMEGRLIVSKQPPIESASQKKGIVVIYFCVDENGNIVSTTPSMLGATTLDSELVKPATEYVQKLRFANSHIEKQCGTMKFKFNVE